MHVTSTRAAAAHCGACCWRAAAGRQGARSECTCGTGSAPEDVQSRRSETATLAEAASRALLASPRGGGGEGGRCAARSLQKGVERHGAKAARLKRLREGGELWLGLGLASRRSGLAKTARRACCRANIPMYPAPVVPKCAVRTARPRPVRVRCTCSAWGPGGKLPGASGTYSTQEVGWPSPCVQWTWCQQSPAPKMPRAIARRVSKGVDLGSKRDWQMTSAAKVSALAEATSLASAERLTGKRCEAIS
jgi:hypothetical protein